MKIKNLKNMKIISYILITLVLATSLELPAFAFSGTLPSAGINFTFGDNTASLKDLQEEQLNHNRNQNQGSANNTNSPAPSVTAIPTATPGSGEAEELINGQKKAEETRQATLDKSMKEKERELDQKREEEGFKNLVIAKVNDYVNVRSLPSEQGEIIGKLYNKSVGNLLDEEDGWYQIHSGTVIGYVKAEFCVTGEDAIELAKEVGTRIASVNTTTLKVRDEPSTEAIVLGLVPIEEELLVEDELGEWVKVSIEEGDGYVHADYVDMHTEFVVAESKAEEEARLAREAAERRAAQAAAQQRAARNSNQENAGSKNDTPVVYASGGGSELGNSVANFGLQFVGNPYKYGGNSLTSGADCSGFTTAVYANFGVSLPRTSGSQRKVGTAVDGLENAQPGDLVCYSGHVGIYIGNGQIVHASTKQTGIKISNATYRKVLAVRRIF